MVCAFVTHNAVFRVNFVLFLPHCAWHCRLAAAHSFAGRHDAGEIDSASKRNKRRWNDEAGEYDEPRLERWRQQQCFYFHVSRSSYFYDAVDKFYYRQRAKIYFIETTILIKSQHRKLLKVHTVHTLALGEERCRFFGITNFNKLLRIIG